MRRLVALAVVLLAVVGAIVLLATPPRDATDADATHTPTAPGFEAGAGALAPDATETSAQPKSLVSVPEKGLVVAQACAEWTGIVVDAGGRPVEGATVWRIAILPVAWVASVPNGLAPLHLADAEHVQTDAHGAFALKWSEAPEGEIWAVLVRHPRGVAALVPCSGELAQGGDMGTIRLQPAAVVRGRVLAADGSPAADAAVKLDTSRRSAELVLATSLMLPWAEGLHDVLFSVRTSADGRFEIGGLPGGDVTASVEARGHLPFRGEPQSLPASGELDLGDLKLQRGGVVAGRVVDPHGRPVAGAEVRGTPDDLEFLKLHEHGIHLQWEAVFWPWTQAAAADGARWSAVSGPDGRFEIGGLRASLTSLVANAEGFDPGAVANVSTGAQDVEIRLGAQGTLHLRLVDAETGQPIEGATLEARRVEDLGAVTHPGQYGLEIEDLGHGEFLLHHACAGPLGLLVRAPALGLVVLACPGLQAGEDEALRTLPVPRAAVVRGRLVTRDGQPLAGRVGLTASGDGEPLGSLDVVDAGTDAQGRFDSGPLPAGRWELRASADGRASIRRELQLQAGEQRLVEDLVLPGLAHVVATVVDSERRPVPGVLLALTAADTAPGGSPLFTSLTDESGRATFHVEPQSLRLERREPLQLLELGPVAEGETREVVLAPQPPARLTGTVRDAQGPVAGARVEFEHARGSQRATSDAEGRWTLELPGGLSGRLGAWSPSGGFTLRDPVATSAGDTQSFELVFESGVLRGRVLDAVSGEPLAGLAVQGSRGGPPFTREVTTDAEGRFEIGHLADGSWALTAVGKSFASPAAITVRVPEDSGRELVLRMKRLATVTGSVRTAAGFPATTKCVVYLLEAGADGVESAHVGDDASFVFEGVEPGEVELAIGRAPGLHEREWSRRDEVEKLAWTRVTVRVEAGARIEQDLILPAGR